MLSTPIPCTSADLPLQVSFNLLCILDFARTHYDELGISSIKLTLHRARCTKLCCTKLCNYATLRKCHCRWIAQSIPPAGSRPSPPTESLLNIDTKKSLCPLLCFAVSFFLSFFPAAKCACFVVCSANEAVVACPLATLGTSIASRQMFRAETLNQS